MPSIRISAIRNAVVLVMLGSVSIFGSASRVHGTEASSAADDESGGEQSAEGSQRAERTFTRDGNTYTEYTDNSRSVTLKAARIELAPRDNRARSIDEDNQASGDAAKPPPSLPRNSGTPAGVANSERPPSADHAGSNFPVQSNWNAPAPESPPYRPETPLRSFVQPLPVEVGESDSNLFDDFFKGKGWGALLHAEVAPVVHRVVEDLRDQLLEQILEGDFNLKKAAKDSIKDEVKGMATYMATAALKAGQRLLPADAQFDIDAVESVLPSTYAVDELLPKTMEPVERSVNAPFQSNHD